MDYVLDDVSDDASALWLDAWSLGRRNPTLAAEAAVADRRLAGRSSAASCGTGGDVRGVHASTDVDVAARRLLIMIDGLGAQKVIRDAATDEVKHIARSYVASELGLAPVDDPGRRAETVAERALVARSGLDRRLAARSALTSPRSARGPACRRRSRRPPTSMHNGGLVFRMFW